MDIFSSVIVLLTEVGKFINAERRTKYQDKVFDLKGRYDEEMAKGDLRDDALIYSLRRELRDICELYGAELKGSSPTNQP